MDLDDPIIRRLCQCVLALLLIIFLYVALLSSWVVVDWDGSGNRSQVLIKAISSLPSLPRERSGDVKTIFAILVSSLPMIVATVCFSTIDGVKRINIFGGFMLVGLFLSILMAVIGYIGIDLSWKDGFDLGEEGLTRIVDLAKGVLSASVFYVTSILGLKAQK